MWSLKASINEVCSNWKTFLVPPKEVFTSRINYSGKIPRQSTSDNMRKGTLYIRRSTPQHNRWTWSFERYTGSWLGEQREDHEIRSTQMTSLLSSVVCSLFIIHESSCFQIIVVGVQYLRNVNDHNCESITCTLLKPCALRICAACMDRSPSITSSSWKFWVGEYKLLISIPYHSGWKWLSLYLRV